jgi:hypothetical protein
VSGNSQDFQQTNGDSIGNADPLAGPKGTPLRAENAEKSISAVIVSAILRVSKKRGLPQLPVDFQAENVQNNAESRGGTG